MSSRDSWAPSPQHSSSSLASPSTSEAWRLIAADAGGAIIPQRGAANMAIDDALLESVQAGGPPVLRFYAWSPACLSFGRNQITRGVYDPAIAKRDNIDVVRRPTGGLAVLHDRELTYSVTVQADLLGGPRATYETVNRALVDGLARVGVAATLAGPESHAPRPESAHPCFHEPSAGEIMAGGGKLVGSAQRCERKTILQHGSILLDGNQASLVAYQIRSSQHGTALHATSGVSLRSILGRIPDMGELVGALRAGFEATLGICLAPVGLSQVERERAAILEARYDSEEWTWRR